MPAQRSRTHNWRLCLQQLLERNGALELAVARHSENSAHAHSPPALERAGRHLIWRVRLLAVHDAEILVEQPMAMGQPIPLQAGAELVGIMAIGQNRWLFRTASMGLIDFPLKPTHCAPGGAWASVPAVRLLMPETVERCQRREFYRIETLSLMLPEVEIWPLLNPESVIPAERANELRFEADLAAGAGHFSDLRQSAPRDPSFDLFDEDNDMLIPEVGPRFTGQLANLGGGGVGIRVIESDAQPFNHHKLFWMRAALTPELTTPICVTARVVHTHIESGRYVYAGMAFDFAFNPTHQKFVVDQICRYIAEQQKAQLRQTAEPERRTA